MENELTNEIDFSNNQTLELLKFILESKEISGVKIHQIMQALNYNYEMIKSIYNVKLVKTIKDFKEKQSENIFSSEK